jgi:hypothetical protein
MKTYALETIEPRRKIAQEIVCYCAFYMCCIIAAGLMIGAVLLPTMTEVTAKICWISMTMEFFAIIFGYIAYWVKHYTL